LYPIGSEDKEQLMTTARDRWTAEALLAAFDEHLRRARGVGAGTRRNYARFVGALLETVFTDVPVDPARIGVGDVIDFVDALTRRYQPRTVELAASSLRSFSGSCARRVCATTGWRTRFRWCRTAGAVLFVIWIRDASSS
jgi:hypothetical protein